jgi:hypothetical protein
MNKEKILEKSRKENKGQDVYEQEIMQEGGNLAAVVAVILATIFFVIQILVGSGQNYGLYAVVGSVLATGYIVKAVRLKRKREIFVAVVWTVLTLVCSAAHIYQLITTSTIL